MKILSIAFWILAAAFGPAMLRAGSADNLAAIVKSEAGDVDGAATLAGRDNKTPEGSLSWYHESAAALIQEAFSYRAGLNFDDSRRAGRAAAQVLAYGLKQKGSKESGAIRAQSYVMMAQLSDLVLGDTKEARRLYRQALLENPDDPVAIQALASYKAQDDNAERIHRKGR